MVDMTLTRDRIVLIGRAQAKPKDQSDVGISTWMDFSTASTYNLDLGNSDQTGVFGVPRSIYIDNSDNPSPLSVTAIGTQFLLPVPANSTGYYKLDSINTSAQLSFVSVGGATAYIASGEIEVPPSALVS